MEKLEKIVLIDVSPTLPTLGNLLGMPRFGVGVVGSVLSNAGYQVTIYSDVYKNVSSNLVVSNNPDVVMFGGLRSSLNKISGLSVEVKKQMPKVPIIVGGEEATISPENVRKFADYILQFEGDERILQLVEVLKSEGDLSRIKGLHYKDQAGKWRYTEKPQRMQKINFQIDPRIYSGLEYLKRNNWLAKQFNLVPNFQRRWSRYSALSEWRYLSFPLQTSRGCPYSCSFCSKDALFGGQGYVERKIEDVLSDVDSVIEYSGITRFSIVDNLFGFSREYLRSFCDEVRCHFRGRKNKPTFAALMRADQLTDEETVKLLRNAGFESLTIGVDSLNYKTRQQYSNGKRDIKIFEVAAKLLLVYGIRAVATFAVGGGEDKKEDIVATVEFAKKNNVEQIQLYPFYITRGSREYKINNRLVIPNVPSDYYNGHAVTILPRRMLPTELQERSLSAMEKFYSPLTSLGLFYRLKLRQIRNSLSQHFSFLRKIETGLIERGIYEKSAKYNEWRLNEQKLRELNWACLTNHL
ncbi:MAG: radical SAM protein [Nitrosopumilus sp.]